MAAMRRDDFLRSLGVLAAAAALPARARAGSPLRMMIPANPGGGWDSTGRALGLALIEARVVEGVVYDNKGGAAGALGLAQFVTGNRGNPDALLVMGAVMLGGIITGRPPVNLSMATPVARLTSEYNVFVLPEHSPYRTMADVVAQMKKDPGSIKWGGGSRGSTEHIAAALIAQQVGVDPSRVNYVAFRGGGEAIAAVLGGNVTVGGSSYSEFADYIRTGRMKPLAVTAPQRLPGVAIPTLRELGIAVEIANWRGVYGAPGLGAGQRKALIDKVVAATRTRAWREALQRNVWADALLTGAEFGKFVEQEFTQLRAIMAKTGLV